jgi:hypothetical protein
VKTLYSATRLVFDNPENNEKLYMEMHIFSILAAAYIFACVSHQGMEEERGNKFW